MTVCITVMSASFCWGGRTKQEIVSGIRVHTPSPSESCKLGIVVANLPVGVLSMCSVLAAVNRFSEDLCRLPRRRRLDDCSKRTVSKVWVVPAAHA